jgi:cytochrome c oxidase assembly factor CtaG
VIARGRTRAGLGLSVAAAALLTVALPGFHDRLTGQMAGQALAMSLAAPLFAAFVPARRRPPAGACLAGFAAATVLFHLPAFLRFAVVRPWAHGLAMVVLLAVAVAFYRPLVGHDPDARLPGPARLPYALLAMIPAEAMGVAMMASDTAWQSAAAVMMAGSVTIGLIGLASTWSWLTAELGEGSGG